MHELRASDLQRRYEPLAPEDRGGSLISVSLQFRNVGFSGGMDGYVRIWDGVIETNDGSTSVFYVDDVDLEADLLVAFDPSSNAVPALSFEGMIGLALLLGAVTVWARVRRPTRTVVL